MSLLSQSLLNILKANSEAMRPTLTKEQEQTIRLAAFKLDALELSVAPNVPVLTDIVYPTPRGWAKAAQMLEH